MTNDPDTPSLGHALKENALDGAWRNNIVFGQLLALCPLLAVTTSFINGLGMGLASAFVLVLSNTVVSLLRPVIVKQLRIVIFVMVIATLVTVVDLLMNAYLHQLHRVLGLFIPLIVTNCAVLGRAEAYASRKPVLLAAADGLFMGFGFILALVMVGAVREVSGQGTLFAGAETLLGPAFAQMSIQVVPQFDGFLISLLPPGGFFSLAFILAAKQHFENLRNERTQPKATSSTQFVPLSSVSGTMGS